MHWYCFKRNAVLFCLVCVVGAVLQPQLDKGRAWHDGDVRGYSWYGTLRCGMWLAVRDFFVSGGGGGVPVPMVVAVWICSTEYQMRVATHGKVYLHHTVARC